MLWLETGVSQAWWISIHHLVRRRASPSPVNPHPFASQGPSSMSSSEPVRSRPHSIYIRLDQAEYRGIGAAASAAGISNAAFVRRQALAAIGAPEITPARRGGTSLPPEDVAAVAALSADVRRQTGATVQLAKALRDAGHGSFHALAERILADLRRQADDLTTIIARLK